MPDYSIILNSLYSDPFDYIKEIENKRYRSYLTNRLKDILPDLKADDIKLDMWSFRRFMSFLAFLNKKDIYFDFSYSVTDNGNSAIQKIDIARDKYLYIEFSREGNFYMNRISDMQLTSGFTKLLKEIKLFLS